MIRLKAWYESEGRSLAPQSISREVSGGRENRKFVSQIKDEGLGRGNKPDYIAVRGTITFIKQVSSTCACGTEWLLLHASSLDLWKAAGWVVLQADTLLKEGLSNDLKEV